MVIVGKLNIIRLSTAFYYLGFGWRRLRAGSWIRLQSRYVGRYNLKVRMINYLESTFKFYFIFKISLYIAQLISWLLIIYRVETLKDYSDLTLALEGGDIRYRRRSYLGWIRHITSYLGWIRHITSCLSADPSRIITLILQVYLAVPEPWAPGMRRICIKVIEGQLLLSGRCPYFQSSSRYWKTWIFLSSEQNLKTSTLGKRTHSLICPHNALRKLEKNENLLLDEKKRFAQDLYQKPNLRSFLMVSFVILKCNSDL